VAERHRPRKLELRPRPVFNRARTVSRDAPQGAVLASTRKGVNTAAETPKTARGGESACWWSVSMWEPKFNASVKGRGECEPTGPCRREQQSHQPRHMKEHRLCRALTLEYLSQTILQRHLRRALRRRCEPVFEVLTAHLMFDFRMLNPYYEDGRRSSAVGIPFALAENSPRLRHRLVKALCGNLHTMFNPLSVPKSYSARSDGSANGQCTPELWRPGFTAQAGTTQFLR
jgi:hypothetical protein